MPEFPKPDRSRLRTMFRELLERSIAEVGHAVTEDVEDYMLGLLVDSVRSDSRLALTSPRGHRLASVVELLEWCEVGLKADSFEEERAAHVKLGDYVLFWTGAKPSMLGPDPGVFRPLAKESYRVAATFVFHPHGETAPTLSRLSDRFDEVAECLRRVYSSLRAFEA